MRSHASPPQSTTFVASGAPDRQHVLGFPPDILVKDKFWRLCEYDGKPDHAARGMCRFDPARGVADMLWPLATVNDEPLAIAQEASGALVMATGTGLVRLKAEGGVDVLGGPQGHPRGVRVTADRIEVVTGTSTTSEIHTFEGGKWTSAATPAPAPPGGTAGDLQLEVAVPRSDGWYFVWSTAKEVFESSPVAPTKTLGAVPAGTRPIDLVDPTPGNILRSHGDPPLALGDDDTLAPAPAPPPDSETALPPAYLLDAKGLHLLPTRTKKDLSRTTLIAGHWYTLVRGNDGWAVGPDGTPGGASVYAMLDPRLLPVDPRWVLASETGEYATLDTSFSRVDGLGPYARVARMFTNYDNQADIDMTQQKLKAATLPVVLLGLPALMLLAAGLAALFRRPAALGMLVASIVYILAAGASAKWFYELTQIL